MSGLTPSVSIIIADDHPLVLRGVVTLLESHREFVVMAQCTDGAAALFAIREFVPDIAILDIAMPTMDGLEIVSILAAEKSRTKIILLTVSASDSQVLKAISDGVRAILIKDTVPDDLIRCIHEVKAGRYWLPAETVSVAIERETGRRIEAGQMLNALTKRERDVMLLVSEGQSNKQIARCLNLSEGTVKIHLHNILQKVGVQNRTMLRMLAVAHRDLLSLPMNNPDRKGQSW